MKTRISIFTITLIIFLGVITAQTGYSEEVWKSFKSYEFENPNPSYLTLFQGHLCFQGNFVWCPIPHPDDGAGGIYIGKGCNTY